MLRLLLLLPLVSFSSVAQILWKPDSISFELKQAHKLLKTGLILELNQKLESNETGWKQARIDVPENWKNAKLEIRDSIIYITTKNDEYYISDSNMGSLQFAILDGGRKSDDQLLLIWNKHASKSGI